MFFLIIVFFFALIILFSSVHVIKQSQVGIVMRLGKFNRKAETGVNFVIPFIERIAYKIDLREKVIDFEPQPVITKDNVGVQIDSVVYYRVTDPVNYVFEIAEPIRAIENLTATTLRNLLGELELDATLTSRDTINTQLRSILDEATDKWGIKVNRVELKNIMPSKAIMDSMEKQMRAERSRRESILQAEGERESSILIAEGEKSAAILRAEAEKEKMIRMAEGYKQSCILRAEGEAEALLKNKEAEAEGLKSVFNAIKESEIDDKILALRSMEALEKIAEGDSSKLVLPSDAINFLGTFKGIKEVMSGTTEN